MPTCSLNTAAASTTPARAPATSTTAYLNWAGITAGKANSFFSAFGGGEGWANLFSPDQQGYNQPLLLAYTATFGGGFSATISLQDPVLGGPSGPGVDEVVPGSKPIRACVLPTSSAAIDLTQSWGTAHVAGVAHNVNVAELGTAYTENIWGWAIDGGLKFNLPTLGAGDEIQIQGAWSRNATWYSGLPGAMWDEGGASASAAASTATASATPIADTYSQRRHGHGAWATPTAWSIAASGEFHFSPVFLIAPEIGYGQLHWSGSPRAGSRQREHLDGRRGVPLGSGCASRLQPRAALPEHQPVDAAASMRPSCSTIPWQSTQSGLEGRFEITRDF